MGPVQFLGLRAWCIESQGPVVEDRGPRRGLCHGQLFPCNLQTLQVLCQFPFKGNSDSTIVSCRMNVFVMCSTLNAMMEYPLVAWCPSITPKGDSLTFCGVKESRHQSF